MKIYYAEIISDQKVNMMAVDMSQRHKVWIQHPTAREISKKEYYQMKEKYNQKEVSNAI